MEANRPDTYSIVVPVYNGAFFLEELFSRTKKSLEQKNAPFEFIFVDDHSDDESWGIIKMLKEKHPEIISGIQLSKNFGQQNATMCGFFHVKGDFIITMDDDLEMRPEDIFLLVEKQKNTRADIVYGTNKKIGKITLRYAFTRAYKGLSRLEGRNKGKGSSFRLMSRSLVENVKQNAGNFVFIDEVCLWYTSGIEFTEVSVSDAREKKKSRYTLQSLINLAGQQIIFSSVFPLKLMTGMGIVVSIVNFLIGLRFIYRKIVYDVPLGYTSIIISVLFSTGIILFCIGIIGEYLGRIIRASNKVPSFNIREKI